MAPVLGGGLAAAEPSPVELVRTLASTSECSTLSWASADLLCRLHRDPSSIPKPAAVVLVSKLTELSGAGVVEGAPTWKPPTRGRPFEAKQLLGGGAGLAATAQPLGGDELEAASSLLATLLDVLRLRPEDAEHFRGELLKPPGSGPSCVWLFLRLLASGGIESGGGAFVHACHVLALVAEGDEELCSALRSMRLQDIVADRLLRATSGDELGTEWLPFATAATHLLDILITAEDSACLKLENPAFYQPVWATGDKPNMITDALIAALSRSLLRERGCMVVQPLHLSGLRTLGHVAKLSRHTGQQALRMLSAQGAELAVAVMNTSGADEEAFYTALRFLAQAITCSRSPLCARKLVAAGADVAAAKALERYPKSQRVADEAQRVLASAAGKR